MLGKGFWILLVPVVVVALGSVAAAGAVAGTTGCSVKFTWKANGHQYEGVCQKNVTWAQAIAGAKRAGGHLATLQSASENLFVFSHVKFSAIWRPNGQGQSAGPWIGLYQKPGSAEPSGGWTWVTGEPLAWADWSPGEPNNYQVQENGAIFWNTGSGPTAKWDDIARAPKLGYTGGYVIEWDK
ncbi:MAG TPA: lectin-like protein [Gaiellaceae bacterium]|jgi:hypothetical protein|nr:lectin-like protein [Gaiellaceae bacterium]